MSPVSGFTMICPFDGIAVFFKGKRLCNNLFSPDTTIQFPPQAIQLIYHVKYNLSIGVNNRIIVSQVGYLHL